MSITRRNFLKLSAATVAQTAFSTNPLTNGTAALDTVVPISDEALIDKLKDCLYFDFSICDNIGDKDNYIACCKYIFQAGCNIDEKFFTPRRTNFIPEKDRWATDLWEKAQKKLEQDLEESVAKKLAERPYFLDKNVTVYHHTYDIEDNIFVRKTLTSVIPANTYTLDEKGNPVRTKDINKTIPEHNKNKLREPHPKLAQIYHPIRDGIYGNTKVSFKEVATASMGKDDTSCTK